MGAASEDAQSKAIQTEYEEYFKRSRQAKDDEDELDELGDPDEIEEDQDAEMLDIMAQLAEEEKKLDGDLEKEEKNCIREAIKQLKTAKTARKASIKQINIKNK